MPNTANDRNEQLDTAIIEWDVATWRQAIPFWADRVNLEGKRVLEVGSRRGGLSLWAALNGSSSVACSDLGGPEAEARELHQKYGVGERVSYFDVNACDLSGSADLDIGGGYDVVMLKSVLGGIGANGRTDLQSRALRSIADVLRPGGCLLFAENLDGSPMHRLLRRFTPWGKAWNYLTERQLLEQLQPFSRVEIEAVGFLAVLGRTEQQRKFLAALDSRILRLVPHQWRYVAIGVAWK